MLKQNLGISSLKRIQAPWSITHRKEVMKMAGKKDTCGCGCVPMKENSTKAANEKEKPKKSK
jgi:hypothetical protein